MVVEHQQKERASTSSFAKKWRRVGTLVALGFGHFVDSGEEQSMGILYPAIKSLWGLSNFNLGLVGTVRTVMAAIAAPFWGYAADRWSRKLVLFVGTGIWGIWTLLCGLVPGFGSLLVIRAISGIGLGCLLPATFSLVSDAFPPERRGRALGILGGVGALGIIVGVVAMGFLSSNDPGWFGLEKWRWGFAVLGGMSVLSGLFILVLVREPVRGESEPELAGRITGEDADQYRIRLSDLRKVLRIPTIWVATLQGMAGSMPWVVLGQFFPTWLVEAKGMSPDINFSHANGSAPIVFALILVGTAISNVVGGYIGDWADRISPKYGRTIIGQISVFSGVPMVWIILTQTSNWSLPAFLVLCFFTALTMSWAGRGAKQPMMQGAVPPELRSSAYAANDVIERGFSALISVVAGGLAGDTVEEFTRAMLWTIPGPWILCFIFFAGFYWAYPRDAARLRAEMARRGSELGAAKT
jgi:MFS family permease